jgi:hypothetical protein
MLKNKEPEKYCIFQRKRQVDHVGLCELADCNVICNEDTREICPFWKMSHRGKR